MWMDCCMAFMWTYQPVLQCLARDATVALFQAVRDVAAPVHVECARASTKA